MRRLTVLGAAMKNLDLSLKPGGKVSVEEKLKDIYQKNAYDENGNKTEWGQGVSAAKARRSAITGLSMKTPDEDVFVKMVQARMNDPEHPASGELKAAIKKVTATDILTEKRDLSSTLVWVEDQLGRSEKSSTLWKRFKRHSGYTGSEEDLKNVVKVYAYGKEQIVYTNKSGKKWLMMAYYDKKLKRVVGDYQEL